MPSSLEKAGSNSACGAELARAVGGMSSADAQVLLRACGASGVAEALLVSCGATLECETLGCKATATITKTGDRVSASSGYMLQECIRAAQ